jgi:hypothetical protein
LVGSSGDFATSTPRIDEIHSIVPRTASEGSTVGGSAEAVSTATRTAPTNI